MWTDFLSQVYDPILESVLTQEAGETKELGVPHSQTISPESLKASQLLRNACAHPENCRDNIQIKAIKAMWHNATDLLPIHFSSCIEWPTKCNTLITACLTSTNESKHAAIAAFCAEVFKASWNLWKAQRMASILKWKNVVQVASIQKSSSKLFKLCTQDPRPVLVEQEKTYTKHGKLQDATSPMDKLMATHQKYSRLYATNNFKCPVFHKIPLGKQGSTNG